MEDAALAAVRSEQVVCKLNRHIIPWLCCLGLLAYLDRTSLAFASSTLNHDLRFSCSVYGIAAGLFFGAYALGQIPCQMGVLRFGAPTWLGAMAVLWGAVAACFAATTGPAMFLALRVLLGVAECSLFPAFFHHLSLFYSPAELGPAYSWVATCTALAQVIGGPLAAAILSLDGLFGLRGWQLLFILEGVPSAIFGVCVKLFLAESPATARWLTTEERAWLRRRQDQAAQELAAAHSSEPEKTAAGASSFSAVAAVARDWRVLYLGACWLLIASAMYSLVFWLPLMLGAVFSSEVAPAAGAPSAAPASAGNACTSAEAGGDTEARRRHSVMIALLAAVPFAVAAVAMVVNARLAARANERHCHAGVPLALAALLLALLPLLLRFAPPAVTFCFLVLAAGCCWAFHGPFMSWAAVFLSGAEAAAGFALINSMGAVGGFLGPFTVGLLADGSGGYSAAMLLMSACLAIAALAILAFPVPGQSVAVELSSTLELNAMADSSAGELERSSGPQAQVEQQRHERHRQQQLARKSRAADPESQPILGATAQRGGLP